MTNKINEMYKKNHAKIAKCEPFEMKWGGNSKLVRNNYVKVKHGIYKMEYCKNEMNCGGNKQIPKVLLCKNHM